MNSNKGIDEEREWRVPAHYSDPYFNLSVYKAAPLMYEALKELVDVITLLAADGIFMQRGLKDLGEQAVTAGNKGEKALAKAEGK